MLVTNEQLIDFGFYLFPSTPRSQLTDEQINNRIQEFNDMLYDYGITSPKSIVMFFGNVAQETGKGWFLKEYGDVEYDGTDKYNGVGYIQLTLKSNYEAYARYIYDKDDVGDTLIVTRGQYEVAENYSIDVSG